MKKNIGKILSLVLTISILLIVVFYNTNTKIVIKNSTPIVEKVNNQSSDLASLEVKQLKEQYTPHLGKSFAGFKEALGFKESQNNYFRVNKFGYLGKYQFGKGTLKLIGIYDPNLFLNTPELQEKAFIANAQRNKWVLRRDIKRFDGKYINGVKITESGILAAAHLAGPGSVKKYLRSYGKEGFSDAFGTSIRYYMKKFSGYDTSSIKPLKKVKVSYKRA
ncbi:peptidoglycan-binding protein LysM [Mesoflavibacter profundi]|uniref:peptidoglycan-binding protein LysM n=1 Tax=Mesoflavibacter profundi TaxID=2708110 RepID=UPI00168B816B|nr:peptidoglycan-binding protein LysM [Mesoflavibacter profundi]